MNDDAKKGLFRMFCIVLVAALIIVAAFISGAMYSCKASGGTLTSGYKCVGVEVVKACDIDGVAYIEKVPLYKELYPNGSMSDDYYLGDYPKDSLFVKGD